ncbi:unnamed protein product [Cylicocyclus nassatus]|uniref:Uncharacterized protein n=1 Tax=Cylicocyclus nassatus TaxID=53992 RepID=A0AA36GDA1_CYLNA|nr:unnamed protein product [Cylicocyclus nassatus]
MVGYTHSFYPHPKTAQDPAQWTSPTRTAVKRSPVVVSPFASSLLLSCYETDDFKILGNRVDKIIEVEELKAAAG